MCRQSGFDSTNTWYAMSPFSLSLSLAPSLAFFSCRYVLSKATFSQGMDLRQVALFL